VNDRVDSKLANHNEIIDLKLKNLAKSIKIELQEVVLNGHKHLENRLNIRINEAFRTQKEKVSWGLELLRFAIVAAMFLVSIKL